MQVLHRSQKEAVGLISSLMESSNLFEVQKILKKDRKFKIFAVKYYNTEVMRSIVM